MKPIPEEYVFRWSGSNNLSSAATTRKARAALKFVRQYGADALQEVLQDGKDPITLKWVVEEMLSLLRDSKSSSNTKLDIIRDLREMIKVGALQYQELEKSLRKQEKKEAAPDPFMPKIAKEAS